jgi:hypothetical protein
MLHAEILYYAWTFADEQPYAHRFAMLANPVAGFLDRAKGLPQNEQQRVGV